MEKQLLKTVKRSETGKNENNRLRATGRVPVNVVGNGKSIPVAAIESEVNHLLAAGIRQATLIDLEVEGEGKSQVFVKEIQRFPGTNKVRHIDFYKVTPGKKILTKVSIETTGTPKGAKSGGQFEHIIHEIRVKTTPEDLRDMITVDVSQLEIGDSIKVSQLPVPKSWEIIANGDPIVTSVNVTKAILSAEKTEGADKAATPAAAAAAPAAGAAKGAAASKAPAKEPAKKK
ncbi:MAG: 50S ribosomal protein L25/general stress protein Ctc [Leptospira sp.]|nr:50S ribosomal protein L25/general stress protein Ctc [Leptospira sp.]